MLGIDDPGVWVAYVLCILSTLLCVIYGAINWNKGDEPTQADDLAWAKEEKKVEEEL